MPGKDVRTALIDCFDLWLRVPDPNVLTEIKHIVSSLHDASLLIDDVEDESKLRRGVPVAHAIFGTAPTINAANYVYFLALERCLALGNDGAMRVRSILFSSFFFFLFVSFPFLPPRLIISVSLPVVFPSAARFLVFVSGDYSLSRAPMHSPPSRHSAAILLFLRVTIRNKIVNDPLHRARLKKRSKKKNE